MEWKKRDGSSSIEEVVARNLGLPDIGGIARWEQSYIGGQYHIDGLKEAASLIQQYRHKRIRICGDYDVDGRCASIILFLAARKAGCTKVDVRIPKRISEGYGMQPSMIEEVEEDDALIITVDNGIRAFDAIRLAKQRGMSVIITDHHLPEYDPDMNPVLPEADVIIDPCALNRSAVYDGYCGAGIAYKLSQELLSGDPFAKMLLPYAAIATVSDLMLLREENYCIVKEGLDMITRRTAPPGINALVNEMGIETCTAQSVGFKLGPAINAPGRMYDKDNLTLPLLACGGNDKALELAKTIIQVNNQRKAAVNSAYKAIAETLPETVDTLIVARVNTHQTALAGIIAGRLVETYGYPAIVFSEPDEAGIMNGSARSVNGFDIYHVIAKSDRYISRFGGHAQAAGLAVLESQFENFKADIIRNFDLSGFEPQTAGEAYYDLEIKAPQLAQALALQEQFAPFGQGNEKPIYKITGFRLTEKPRQIAGGGIRFKSGANTAVGFGMWPMIEQYGDCIATYTLYGTLSWNEYYGKRYAQVELLDFEKTSERVQTAFSKKLFSM